MSSIDERIVAMRFDNNQFEKGVKDSMRTLAELREATNLDDVAANMKDVSKSINQNLQFESPAKSAGIFSKALTGLGKVAKTTFNAATFPLQALGRSLQSLGKYTRAVLGIDLASQLVHTGEQVIRAFTIDPLKSGWNEYELKMDSIKTIMTGTVKTYTDAMTKKDPQFLYDEEKHLDYVKQGLEELNTYADQTVYSFQDMTSNIGKFTNAGVDFETAVDAIKGVANAAAHAGQGATQASMAMYNISQSLGMGYLGMMDWRSIENANMATLTFKQTLIDMGVALGQLKKDEQSGKLYTINEKGVVDTSLEVTAENLRETLSKKWVNKEVLLNALRVYSGEFSEEELRGLKNLTDEEKAQLRKIGEEAALAATQVRTFTKMWDALKEAAQSGWAISWELIFGDLNEATDFWTGLNKRFSELLEKQAESRNALLHAWRGQRQQYNYETGEIEWISDERLVDGRKILVDALHEMLDVISEIGGGISEAWTSIFGAITGENLLDVTKKFKGFTKAFSDWVGKRNDPTSRISKLSTGLKGIFSVLKGAGSVVGGAITTISQALRLDKLLDAGISIFGQAGEWLGGLGASISGVWESIGQTEIMQKLSGFFGQLWDSVSNFFTKTNEETGNTGFVDWLDSTFQNLNSIWNWFTETDFYKKAGEIWNTIVGYFSPKTVMGKMGNQWTEDSDFVRHIKTAFNSIKDFFTEVQGWPIWGKISGFFTPIIQTVTDFFSPQSTKSMIKLPQNAVRLASAAASDFAFDSAVPQTQDSPFVAWIKNAFNELKTFFESSGVSEILDTVGNKFSSIVESVVSFFSPKTIVGKMGNTWTGDSEFVTRVKDAFEQIKVFFTEVQGWAVWGEIESFFEPLFARITNIFSAETFDENGEKTGGTKFGNFISAASETFNIKWEEFKTWASGIYESIKGWFEGETWKSVISIFTNIWSSETAETKSEGDKEENDFISKAKATFTEKWESFKTWAEGIYESIKGWFEGETWTSISKFFTEIGTTLSSIFGSKKDKSGEQLDNEAGFFERIMDSVSNLASKAASLDIWDSLSDLFRSIGEMMSSASEAVKSSKLGTTAKGILKLLFESLEDLFIMLHDFLDFFVDPEMVFELGYKGRWNVVIEERVNLLKVVVASIGAIFGSLVTGATSLAVSTAASSLKQFGNIFKSLAIFLGALAAVTAMLSIIPQDARNFVTGALIIVGAIASIIAITVTIGNIMKGAKTELPTVRNTLGNWALDFFDNFLNEVVKWIGIIMLFKEGLPPVINALKGLDANAGSILALFGGVTVLIAAISGLSLLFSKIQVNPLNSMMSGASLATGLLATLLPIILAIGVIGAAANNELTKGIMDAILNGMDWLGRAVKAFNEAAYGKELDHETMVTNLTSLAEPIQGLGVVGDNVNIQGLYRFEEAMQIAQRILSIKVNDATGLSQFLAGELKIDDVLAKVRDLADTIVAFNSKLKDADGNNIDLSNTVEALTAFASLSDIIASMAYIRKNYNNLDHLIQDILNVFSDQDNAGFWEGLETFMTSLGLSINEGLAEAALKIDANPIVAAIVRSLKGGTSDIQQAIEDAVLNKNTAGKTSNGVREAVENATSSVAGGIEAGVKKAQESSYDKLVQNGTYLLSNGWFADFDNLFGQLFGPEGVIGALGGGSLLNYIIGDNASLLPFNFGQILGGLFNVDLSHIIPEGMTLDGVISIFTSGDSEKISELLSSYLGIDPSDLDLGDIQNKTVKDLTALLSKVEGYEGSAMQSFFAANDPNTKIVDLFSKYLPKGFDIESIDWTDPVSLIAEFVGDGFGNIDEELNAMGLGNLGAVFNADEWATWLGISPEAIDFTNLQATVQTIVPAFVEAIVGGISEGLKNVNLGDNSLLDPLWQYLGIDSATIEFTDLQTNVTTVVASIVPTIANGVYDGVTQGLSGLNLLDPVWQWFGVDASKIDTSSLRASIASIAPELVSEVKAGVADGLKNEPLLNMMLSRMLTGGNKSQYSVTPVLDDSGLDGNSLLALQNGSIKLTGSVQIDAVNLGSVISAINSNGSRIVSAVNNMGARIDSLGAAISRIQIVLDTGAVAGAVDSKLGQSTTLQSRTGTPGTRVYKNSGMTFVNYSNP